MLYRSEWISLRKFVPQGPILCTFLFDVLSVTCPSSLTSVLSSYKHEGGSSLSCTSTTVEETISSLQFDGRKAIPLFTDDGVQENPSTWWRHKMKHFPRNWLFVMGIHRSPLDSPHKGQWREAFMVSLMCAWTNVRANNRNAGNLRRHDAHCDVTVMKSQFMLCWWSLRSKFVMNGNIVFVSDKQTEVLAEITYWFKNIFFVMWVRYVKRPFVRINTLARISQYLDDFARRMIYNSFMANSLNYCPFCSISTELIMAAELNKYRNIV